MCKVLKNGVRDYTMTKYVAFKIFDSDNYIGRDWELIKDEQIDNFYTIVHEEYVIPVLEHELKQRRYKNC